MPFSEHFKKQNDDFFFNHFFILCADSFLFGFHNRGAFIHSIVEYFLIFFDNMPDFVKAYFDDMDTKELPNDVQKLLKDKKKTYKLLKESTQCLKKDAQPQVILEKVRALQEGKSLFLSGGWTGRKGRCGHALLYQFIKVDKTRIEFRVINTGDGLTYHESVWKKNEKEYNKLAGEARYHPLTYVMDASLLNVPGVDKQFIAFIDSIRKQKDIKFVNRYNRDQDGGQYLYENILPTFELLGVGQQEARPPVRRDHTLPPPHDRDIRAVKEQYAGTCGGQAAKQIPRNYLLESEYRWFKLLLFYGLCEECISRMERIQEQHHNLEKQAPAQWDRIRLLRSIIENLARYGLFKKIKGGDTQRLQKKLSALTERIKELEDGLITHLTYREPVKIHRPNRSQYFIATNKNCSFQQPRKQNRIFTPPMEQPYVYEESKEEEKSTSGMLFQLVNLTKDISQKKSTSDPYSIVRTIENTLFTMIGKKKGSLRFEDQDKLLHYIQALGDLHRLYQEQYAACSKTGKSTPAQCITAMGILFLITRLAQDNKQYISNYFSDYLPFYLKHFIERNADGYLCSGSPEHDSLLHHIMHALYEVKRPSTWGMQTQGLGTNDDSDCYFRGYHDLVNRIFTDDVQQKLKKKTNAPLCPIHPYVQESEEVIPFLRCKQAIDLKKTNFMPTTFHIQTNLESLFNGVYGGLGLMSGLKVQGKLEKELQRCFMIYANDEKCTLEAPTYSTDVRTPHRLTRDITGFRGTLGPDAQDIVGYFRRALFDGSYHRKPPKREEDGDKNKRYQEDWLLSPHMMGVTLLQKKGCYNRDMAMLKALWATKLSPTAQLLATIGCFAQGHPDFFLRYSKILEMNLFDKYFFIQSLSQHGDRAQNKLNAFLLKIVERHMNDTDASPVLNAIKMLVFTHCYALQAIGSQHVGMMKAISNEKKEAIRHSALTSLRALTRQIAILVKTKQGTDFPFGTLSAYRAMIAACEIVYGNDSKQLPQYWEQFLTHQIGYLTRDIITEHDTGAFFMLRQRMFSDMFSKIAEGQKKIRLLLTRRLRWKR